jgi:hypothetical protein
MTYSANTKTNALTDDELDRVAGGIIIVGGFLNHYQLFQPSSVIDRVALNPQPLPPRISFGQA